MSLRQTKNILSRWSRHCFGRALAPESPELTFTLKA
jgi:hypothetical protein